MPKTTGIDAPNPMERFFSCCLESPYMGTGYGFNGKAIVTCGDCEDDLKLLR